MNEIPEIDDPAFEAKVTHEMRRAVLTVEPDVEIALQAVRNGGLQHRGRGRGRGAQRLLAVAAGVAVVAAGVIGVSRLGSSENVVVEVADGVTTTTERSDTAGPATTVAPPIPQQTRRSLVAAEIPDATSPLTGGVAVRIVTEFMGTDFDEPDVFVEIFVDSGEVFTAASVDGPFDFDEDNTVSLKREVLDSGLPTDEVAAAFRATEAFNDFVFSEAEADERLWGDALDLLESSTLSNEQRAVLFEVLETEIGVTYAIVSSEDDGVDTLEIRWNGHSANEPWVLSLDAATALPVQLIVGDPERSEGPSVVVDYTVDRISMADIEVTPTSTTPPTSPDDGPVESATAVVLDGQGLLAVDSETQEATLVPFGSARSQVIALVEVSYGAAGGEMLLSECGGGPLAAVSWGGLTLFFVPNDADPAAEGFLGWSVNDTSPVITTIDGLGVGSSVDSLTATLPGEVYEESTLGWEYSAGGITWLADETGSGQSIDVFWAGESCVFR